jgi:hypothetical protein
MTTKVGLPRNGCSWTTWRCSSNWASSCRSRVLASGGVHAGATSSASSTRPTPMAIRVATRRVAAVAPDAARATPVPLASRGKQASRSMRTRRPRRTSWERPRRGHADFRSAGRCGSGQQTSRGAWTSSRAGVSYGSAETTASSRQRELVWSHARGPQSAHSWLRGIDLPTAARKSARSRASSNPGPAAWAVAVRGVSRGSAISPKKPPGPIDICQPVRLDSKISPSATR